MSDTHNKIVTSDGWEVWTPKNPTLLTSKYIVVKDDKPYITTYIDIVDFSKL